MASLVLVCLLLQDPASLVDLLDHDCIEVRHRAADSLRALGDAAIPALEAARGDLARTVLRDLGATSILIEDLRSDDIPGNAKAARVALIRRYNPAVRAALLRVIGSDDDQQAIEAAFVLIARGDSDALLRAAPDMAARAMGVYARDEAERFEWVAGHVMLRLGPADAAFEKALRGVDPASLHRIVRNARELTRQLKVPFPLPLLRHYLKNLRDDDTEANSFHCRWVVGEFGLEAFPLLLDASKDADAQQRHRASEMLLSLARHLHPLLRYEALQAIAAAGHPTSALDAMTQMVAIDPGRWTPQALDLALRNLQADTFARNAWEATALLVRIGRPAVPALVRALGDDDEQVVTCAALALVELDALPDLGGAFDRVYRNAARDWGRDESRVMKTLMARSPALWARVSDRLQRSGKAGRRRAGELGEDLRAAERAWSEME